MSVFSVDQHSCAITPRFTPHSSCPRSREGRVPVPCCQILGFCCATGVSVHAKW